MTGTGPGSTAGQMSTDPEALKMLDQRAPVGRRDRKTVTFGDSAAVKSDSRWSVVSLVGIIALWYVATKPWGLDFSDPTQDLSQQQALALCDKNATPFEGCKGSYSQLISYRKFPSIGDTWNGFKELNTDGFQNITLLEQSWASLWRVLRGMFWGIVLGVPIGLAMGLSDAARGFFDTIVELLRPIPPFALIPLFILAFGIGDGTAVNLLIYASVWIMIIAARSGVRAANLSKVRAAYSLGASKWQVLTRVLIPNALPELFTGVRVALGVSWGTLVAAELVGARDGLGQMIFAARPFFRLDVMVVGIIVIAVLGVVMDVLLRFLESILIPWRGKG
jgi:taurine transport system permease protein